MLKQMICVTIFWIIKERMFQFFQKILEGIADMARNTGSNPIGTLPTDPETCAILRDSHGAIICEAYAYRVGFFRFNWHASLEILFVLEGKLKVFSERAGYELTAGDFIAIQPNEGHASMIEMPGTVAAVLHISQKYLGKICTPISVFPCAYSSDVPRDSYYNKIRSAFASFYRLTASGDSLGDRICAEAELMSIIGTLVLMAPTEKNRNETVSLTRQQQQKLVEIHRQIEKNYLLDLSLESLAASVGMNASYLSSFFKKHMQIGLHEYVTRKRLAHAVWLLNNSQNTVLDIAVNSGFPDAKSLYAAFRKYFNMTPNAYRAKLVTRVDTTAQNYIPTRFLLNDPYVLGKLSDFHSSKAD